LSIFDLVVNWFSKRHLFDVVYAVLLERREVAMLFKELSNECRVKTNEKTRGVGRCHLD